jgi:hypothetical protein
LGADGRLVKEGQRLFSSIGLTFVGQFLEVMREAVEFPPDVDLEPAARGEVVEALVAPQVGKYRLDAREAPAVDSARFWLVDLAPFLRHRVPI